MPSENARIIPILDTWLVNVGRYIVMPRFEPSNECYDLPVPTILPLAQQLLDGLSFLHHNRVVHRDLKPHNVVVDRKRTRIYIIDFDLAEIIDGDDDLDVGFTGSAGFTPPEVGEPDSPKESCYRMMPVDIWACGVLLTYLAASSTDNDSPELRVLKDVADQMTNPDPSLRLDADGALAMLFAKSRQNIGMSPSS